MGSQRKLSDAGIREAYIVSWRRGNGSQHTEAFATEAGANEFVRRNSLKAHIYKGVVMAGLFPADAERGRPADAAAITNVAAADVAEGPIE